MDSTRIFTHRNRNASQTVVPKEMKERVIMEYFGDIDATLEPISTIIEVAKCIGISCKVAKRIIDAFKEQGYLKTTWNNIWWS